MEREKIAREMQYKLAVKLLEVMVSSGFFTARGI